ncbi:head-tail connector protein [bacterium]|nr:head-tail connector protein [bacterium]
MEKKAKEIIDRYSRLKGERSQWDSLYEDVCTFVTPRRGGIVAPRVKGGSRMGRVFSCTAIDANDTFAAGLYGHLCSPPWFVLRPQNPQTEISDEENTWYSEATRILHEELAVSNFNLAVFEHFKDLGAIGSGCLFVEEGEKTSLNFLNLFIADFVYQENRHGLIDTVYRHITYTARQAVQEFGEDNVGPSVIKAYREPKDIDKRFEFIHAIYPDKGQRFPFKSIYVAVKDKLVVREGGYYELPCMADRLDKESNETYGRGIGVKMLPEIKLLNKMVETTIRAAEKVVEPPLMVPDDGFLSPLRTVPGGILYYRAGTPDRIEPLNTHANIGLGLEMEAKREDAIKQAFFVDLFKLLAERKNMTATEVLERVEEKLVILGPMLGRLQSELFNPLIERCLGIVYRAGLLPPLPSGLSMYSVQFTGKLAMAMKQMEVRSVQNTFNLLAPWAQVNPAIMDNFDQDKIARGIGERVGLPGEWLRPKDDVDALRQQQQEAQAQEAQMQMAQEAAKVLPDETKERILTSGE